MTACASAGNPAIQSRVTDGGKNANVSVTWPVTLDEAAREAQLSVRILSAPDGILVAKTSQAVALRTGQNHLKASLSVPSPKLWSTWDRGGPSLYRAELELRDGRTPALTRRIAFGIRSVELKRGKEETRFYLNGKPLYLRGTTYWPDVYISASDRGTLRTRPRRHGSRGHQRHPRARAQRES